MKKQLFLILCLVLLALLATSCYTTHNCPAYGHYSELLHELDDNS